MKTTILSKLNTVGILSLVISFCLTSLNAQDVNVIINNASSENSSDGSITLEINEGEAPFEFEWIDPNGNPISNATDQLNNLLPGTYCVTISDASCCEASGCFCVGYTDMVQIEDISCFCSQNFPGGINVSTDSNFGDYSFTWTGPNNYTSSLEDPDDISSSGYYTLIATSEDGCTSELTAEVQSCLTVELISSSCICNGGYGQIDIDVVGGTGNYQYSWLGTGSIGNVQDPIIDVPGNYSVEVTDLITGCSGTLTTLIEECDLLISSFVDIVPDCSEEGTSSISIQIPEDAGLAPFEITWIELGTGILEVDQINGGIATVDNLGTGEYCVTVRSSNGCEDQICGLLIESTPAPEITPSVTPISNPGNSDGVISIDVQGLDNPPSFLWNTGATSNSINNLSADIYSVTVTYNNGECSEELQIELMDCDGLELAISPILANISPITSNGNDASIDILNISEQFSGYHFIFNWSNGATTEDISNLGPGTYTVNIQVEECPSFLISETWTICDFSLDLALTPTDCISGVLSAETSPNNSNYIYQWSTGENSSSINVDFGTEYCVTITDENSCVAYNCVTPMLEELTITANVINATYGNQDGIIEVFAHGGVGPYTYFWENGASGPIRTNLGPGTYEVLVKDDCGNSASLSITIQCEFGEMDLVANVTNVDCTNGLLGSITITQLPNIDHPNPIYKFKWDNESDTQNISNLVAGEYCVTVTEANTGCFVISCFNVMSNGTDAFDIEFESEASCWPTNDGFITATPINGGNSPFSYAWESFGTVGTPPVLSNTPTITGLSSGWYYVTVTDAWGCSSSSSIFLNVNLSQYRMLVTASPNPICAGGTATGIVSFSGAQPPGPIQYEWKNYISNISFTTNENSIDGLIPGNWFVTAVDGDGCEIYNWVTIEDGVELEFSYNVTGNSWYTCDDASIDITVLNSTGFSITYTWSKYDFETQTWIEISQLTGDASGGDLSSITHGLYRVVADDGMCQGEQEITINPGQDVGWNVELVTLENVNSCTPIPEAWPGHYTSTEDGKICLEITGVEEYTIHWDNGLTGSCIENLSPGTYTATIEFPSGCVAPLGIYEICCCSNTTSHPNNEYLPFCSNDESGETEPIVITEADIKSASTSTSADGTIAINFSGGGENITFSWTASNGTPIPNELNLTNLNPGDYCITIEDGCSFVNQCYTIVDCSLNPITLSAETSVACQGLDVGKIVLDVNGGLPPFKFNWSNGETTQSIGMLTFGDFSVTVEDANHCFVEATFTVEEEQVIREDGCVVICGDFMNDSGDPKAFTNVSDCEAVDWICPDGFVEVEGEFVGSFWREEPETCTAERVNEVTFDQCEISFGEECTVCIFEEFEETELKTWIISCDIRLCFYDEEISSDFFIREVTQHNSVEVTTVTMGGFCVYTITNHCDGTETEIQVEACTSEDTQLFVDGDCEFEEGEVFNGDCNGEFLTNGENPTSWLSDVTGKNISIEDIKVKLETEKLVFHSNAECENSTLFYWGLEEGIYNFIFVDELGKEFIRISKQLNRGMNILRLGSVLKKITPAPDFQIRVLLENELLLTYDASICDEEGSKSQENKFDIYPNPFEEELNIELSSKETGICKITLRNAFGKILQTERISVEKGKNNFAINTIKSISNGVYLVVAEMSNGEVYSKKLVKLD